MPAPASSPARAALAAAAPMAALAARLRADPRLAAQIVVQPHPLLVLVRDGELRVLLAPAALWEHGRELLGPFQGELAGGRAALVLLGSLAGPLLDEALDHGLCALLPREPGTDEIFVAVRGALGLCEARQSSEIRGRHLDRYRDELGDVVEMARALSTERDPEQLLALILSKSRLITGADAGSIYVVEGDDPDLGRRRLRFKLTQNDSLRFEPAEFTMPISTRSMAGYVALEHCPLTIDDVYDLPAGSPYGFDRSFDQTTGYRTRSMLCAPLLSRVGDVIGVIQLINRKRDRGAKLLGPEHQDAVVPFDADARELLGTLASLAGVALENAILYAEIERMLDGFVRASVEAIEQRDPTTSGHSRRVAAMCVGLAEAVERTDSGPYARVRWRAGELRELQYAAFLHDFGKIGVPSRILVKAKKLHPEDLDAVRARFALALRTAEIELLGRKLGALGRGAGAAELESLEALLAGRRAELEQALATILEVNEPAAAVSGAQLALIEAIARESFRDGDGSEQPLLRAHEIECLSIARGTLTPAELDEIRRHVSRSVEFLSRVPWGRQLRRLCEIASAHHERLDGTGYPHRLRATEIPLQAKIMAVADIYDALTAADRPYKKAVPRERALAILETEAKEGHIDPELVRIFVAAEIWERVEGEG
ncbi:MAG: GAF domain-containing protein [Deltaproteobacteria bacterium]|nr:GAF domain-containing protein [Deltaproteobacteria bacterium]